MKVLLVVPEIRLDSVPYHFPFWAAILGAIAEKKGANVGILDLNAVRMEFDNNHLTYLISIKIQLKFSNFDENEAPSVNKTI